jgi:hypothetical protein
MIKFTVNKCLLFLKLIMQLKNLRTAIKITKILNLHLYKDFYLRK